ncbi:Epsin-2 [Portunus trituberculatus]|uniref:Epsin-2 n=1 Tax=Portunus trituberculatus TaxID=210409 RepID=A0A5B7CZ78_PORTR|nr:Epsin-2 [Portunus trituberculatus]
MNVSGIRRNLKNIAHNYTDAQIKVREATSNDPWGPSSTLMSEVADLTYNVVAFTEIMQMIWKRLNDHGRNWRHVYKALVLLEYLIKTGSEKVADQCKENIFAIETLKDFQYFEENKDQGMNVREKAKALVTLLKDEERLRNERVRALKAKERFAQSVSGIGSDSKSERNQAEELTIVCDGDKLGLIGYAGGVLSERTLYAVAAVVTVLSLPGVDFSPPPPPVPPLPSSISFPTTFSDGTDVTLRHSNPPLLNSSPLLFATPRQNRSSTPSPNPFHDSPSVPRPTSLLVTSPSTSAAATLPNRHSLFPLSPSSYASLLESPLSSCLATSPTTQPVKPSSISSAASPWGPVQQNLNLAQATRSLDDLFSNGNIMDGLGCGASESNRMVYVVLQTDPWGMALPNGGSETPNQPDPWGSPVSGPPSRMTSPPTTDPWVPARSPEPPMGGKELSRKNPRLIVRDATGICGNDPWAVLGSVPPAKDPWEPVENKPPPTRDPFSPLTPTDNRDLDEFTALSTREKPTNNGSSDAFDLSGLSASVTDITSISTTKPPPQKSKSPAAFLGENSNLVNLDNLVSTKQAPTGLVSPFK